MDGNEKKEENKFVILVGDFNRIWVNVAKGSPLLSLCTGTNLKK